MRRWVSGHAVMLLILGGWLVAFGQQSTTSVTLHPGQAIPLRLLRQISSVESKPGDKIPLEARADVVIDGRVVIRHGAPAMASIAASQRRKTGQGGRLGLRLETITLSDGETLPLSSDYKEGGGTGLNSYNGMDIASTVLLSPGGLAFLFLSRGPEILLPEGTAMEGFVGVDTTIAISKMETSQLTLSGSLGPNGAPAELEALPAAKQTLAITTSAGDGSVWVDGEFRGEAPLTAEMKRGTHTVVVRHDGFKEWKEKVLVEGDGLKMKAELVSK